MGERADPAIVRLDGEQVVATRHNVQLAFQRARANPRVIVDLTRLRHDASVADTVIAELLRAKSRPAGKLVIVARNQRWIQSLSIAGLTRGTPIVATLDDAQNAMRAQ